MRSTEAGATAGAGTRTGAGFELRLERGGVHVRLPQAAAVGGVMVVALDLQIPDVTLPIDVGAGPGQFQSRLCELHRLEVALGPEVVAEAAARLDLAALGLGSLTVALRDGFAEVGGRLAAGPAFALRLGLVAGFERGVVVVPYAPRLFGPAPLPAALLPHLALRALAAMGLPADPLPALLRRLLVARGWKVPAEGSTRLALAAIGPAGVRLAWDRDPPDPAARPADPDLLAAVEGARAFEAAEAHLAAGDLGAARDAYLAAPATEHPFAADRLLSLLCLEERFHDEALDLAGGWLARRPGFAPALSAEAWVRSARGEGDRAALALARLAEEAVAAGERLAAVGAAEAALAQPGAGREARARAVDAALAVQRDHLPALRALRQLAMEDGDKGAHVRAVRRLLAYAPADAEKARAHAELGELLLERDPPAARLHLDRALRLAPDDAESLATLAHACAAAGDHLRAVRAIDRLRALRLAAGDPEGSARLALQAGALWEHRLGHLENAALCYRDAAGLGGPAAAEALAGAARCAGLLGRWIDAADHHAAALSLLDRAAPGAAQAARAHHLALAEVAERHLDDPAGAATHLEAALAGAPADAAQLERLAALYLRLDRPVERSAALDRLAPLAATDAGRAALLAESAALLLRAPDRAEAAQARFTAALGHDPANRAALAGLAAVASLRGDAPSEREALTRLLGFAAAGEEEAALRDRLASACERAGDLAGAARAVAAARRAAPTLGRLAAEVALVRRADDRPALAGLLDEQARAAVAAGDVAGAAAAWRERSELLSDGDPALALASLAEARALLPGDPGLLRREVALATRAGEPAVALGALRALLAGRPDDAPELDLAAARAAVAAGLPAEARPHAERALAADAPGALPLLLDVLTRCGDDAGRAAALSRMGHHQEAAALFEQVGDLAGAEAAWRRASGQPAWAALALRALVRLRAKAGDAAGAAAALLDAARLAGGREGAELALRAYTLAGHDEALEAAVWADPTFAPARAERARRAAARPGADPAAALADAEAALAGEPLEPAERPALLALSARLAAAAGDRELARRRLAAFCQLGQPADEDLAALCDLQRAAGDADGLMSALEKRLATAPLAEAVALRLELAPLLAEHGRDLEAVGRWREVLSLDRAQLPALRALLAPDRAAVLHEGEETALTTLLARHPDAGDLERAAAWAGLAASRLAGGDAAGGAAATAEAERLRGEDDDGLERRAAAAARAGDGPAAATLLLRRARRGLGRGEAGDATRLVDAGLAALEAGLVAEGEAALRQALALHPEPEAACAALGALAGLAQAAGDEAAEAAALAPLVPLLPTGQRPGRLVRLSALRAAAGDAAGALAAAEEARTLAPRDLAAVRQARAAADGAGERRRVADLLAEEAALDEPRAGPLLLDRARLLVRLGDAAAADQAFDEALRLLRPDLALSVEQARLRRAALPDRSAAAPVEACARRCEDPALAARASLTAAALALQEADRAAALRCARRAFARRRDAPAEAGPLLARLLYEGGAFAEALVLHRALFAGGFVGFDDADVVALCRQLGELAAEAGELELALGALDRLLALRPQEAEAALARLALDPDRRRAAEALAEVAGHVRSAATRVELLARAGEVALAEARDRHLGDRLFREARTEAALLPALGASLARRRAAAVRAGELGPEALLGALHEAAEAARLAGDGAAQRALLEEAAEEAGRRGMWRSAAADLAALEGLLAAAGDQAGAAERARQAGERLAEAGDLAGAAEALGRAARRAPSDDGLLRRLAEVSRARGLDGGEDCCRALAALAGRAAHGQARAAALRQLAEAEATLLPDDVCAEASLREALAEVPGDPLAEAALLELLTRNGRGGDRARLLLEQARREAAPAARRARREEAAALLAGSFDSDDRTLAAEALRAVAQEAPDDLLAARAASDALLALGRREEATPLLAALVRADPDDEAAAAALALAYADRHRDRAELFLARAARASGLPRAARLREAAQALLAAHDPVRARQVLVQAFDAWPGDDEAFGAAVSLADDDVERLDAVLSARAGAVPAEAAGCHRARADLLFAVGRLERAAAAYQAALALDGEDPAALATLASCQASVHGVAAARETDRRLCLLAAARPGLVPASLEGEARYRLALGADAEGPVGAEVEDLERALWLAPEDPRADQAFAALVEAQLRLGAPLAALAAARARAERALALGDEVAERAALEAGVALAATVGERGPDAAALLDALVGRRADAGEPLEALVPLAVRAAAAWRALGDQGRARAVLELVGIAPRPLLESVPTPPPGTLEALDPSPLGAALEAVADQTSEVELSAAEPVAEQPVEVEPVEVEPVGAEPVADQTSEVELTAVEPVAEQPVEVEPVGAEPVADQTSEVELTAIEPVAEQPAEVEPVGAEPVADQTSEVELTAVEPVAEQPVEVEPVGAEPVADQTSEVELSAAEPVAEQPVEVEPVGAEPVADQTSEVELSALEADLEQPDALQPVALEPASEQEPLPEPVAVGPSVAGPATEEQPAPWDSGAEAPAEWTAAAEAAWFEPAAEPSPSAEPVPEAPAGAAPAAGGPSSPEPLAAPEPAADPASLEQPSFDRPAIDEPPGDGLVAADRPVDEPAGQEPAPLLPPASAPAEEAAAWLATAEALQASGAAEGEVREAVEAACAADPDGPSPWLSLAALEMSAGQPLAAARAYLAVSIRSEGRGASEPALEAARLFEEAGRHTEAARAYRAANLAAPRCIPAALILAEEALARGDLAAADENLRLIGEAELPAGAVAGFRCASARAAASTGEDGPGAEVASAAEPPGGARPEEEPAVEAPDIEVPDIEVPAPDLAVAAEAPVEAHPVEEPRVEDPPAVAPLVEALPAEAVRTEEPAVGQQPWPARHTTAEWPPAPEPSEAQPPEAQPSEAQPSEAQPSEAQPSEAQPPEAQPSEAQPSEAQPSEPEPSEPQPAEPGPAAARTTTAPWVPVVEPAAPPPDRAAELLGQLREHAAAGDRHSLAALVAEAEALLEPAALRPYAASLGRAELDAGRPESAWRWLSRALQDDPDELTVARDLARAAERTGRHGQEVALGARCADALAPHDPLAAAARLRHLARVADAKLADPERAAALLLRALELVPDEVAFRRELWSLWSRHPATQPQALEAWTEAAQRDPADVAALDALTGLCTALAAGAPPDLAARLRERSRLAASLAAFCDPGRAALPLRPAAQVPDEVRDRLAAPGAAGPLARLLRLLAPYLEPLLPADLARRGAGPAVQLVAPRAPELRQSLEAAGRILGARPYVGFLLDRPGLEVAIENTRPPALLLPAGAESLAAPERLFLAARALDLLDRGWALAGKFAPRDVGILLELACRFAGGAPPPLGLPAQRAGDFLAAMGRSVPPTVASRARLLGPAAADELANTDLVALSTALRRSAARVALLVTGDPGAALGVLLHREPSPEPAEPAAALDLPDLRDLAVLALSDPFLDLRVSVVG
ncbi:MAG: hypothetical protein IPQ24_05700 [Anaeromyxobacter sp.]|nr:hypothetical protein [Anaeromyxobacter sp.]